MTLKEKRATLNCRSPSIARIVWCQFTENRHKPKKSIYNGNKRSTHTWFEVCFVKDGSQTSRSEPLVLLQIPIARTDASFPRFRP